jgi:hypothetical protein
MIKHREKMSMELIEPHIELDIPHEDLYNFVSNIGQVCIVKSII